MERMIGETITEVMMDAHRVTIMFVTNDGRHVYQTENDCCNSVWFEHVSNIDAIKGKVMSVDVLGWENVRCIARVGGEECEEACQWIIRTDKGSCALEVRNNHNGYYGGSVVRVDEAPTGLKLITEDF